jgi:hypothetical protein
MKKIYLLSCIVLFTGSQLIGQETAAPELHKSNRIILHFKDTTGLFTALARILIDRGHDIEFKDREFGILRTKRSPIPGSNIFNNQMEVKTVFRDSTITFASSVRLGGYDSEYEVVATKKRRPVVEGPWDELMLISELLKPASVTYLTVKHIAPPFDGYVKPPK